MEKLITDLLILLILLYFYLYSGQQGRRYWGAGGGHGPANFLRSKKKKLNKGKKERLSKQKLLKGCHQGQNVTVLAILERLEFKKFLFGQPWWPTVLVSVP